LEQKTSFVCAIVSILVLCLFSYSVNYAVGASEDFSTYGGNILFQISGVKFLGAQQTGIEETYDFSATPNAKIQINVKALTNNTLEYPNSENDLQLYSIYYTHFFYEDKGVQRDLSVSASFDAVPHDSGTANSYDVWIEYAYSKSFGGATGYSGTIHLTIKVDDVPSSTSMPTPTTLPTSTPSDLGLLTPTGKPYSSPSSTTDILWGDLDLFSDSSGLLGLIAAIVVIVFIILLVAVLTTRKPKPPTTNVAPPTAILACPVCRRNLTIYQDNYGHYGFCTNCNRSYRI
jgi:hypothetical protein